MAIGATHPPNGQTFTIAKAFLPDAFRELAAAGDTACAPGPYYPMGKAFTPVKADLHKNEAVPGEGRRQIRPYPVLLAIF